MKSISALMLLLVIPGVVMARSGIYIDIQSGLSDLQDVPTASDLGADSLEKAYFPTFRGSVGYLHDFTPLFGFGLEAGRGIYSTYTYHYTDAPTVKARFTTYEFLSIFELHLPLGYDLFTKVGGGRNYFDVNTVHFDNPGPATKIRPIVVIGGNYNIIANFALTVSYWHAFGEPVSNFDSKPWKVPSANALLAGVRISL